MKQLIIARKDLKMSPGKLAAQVSHASMAFLTSEMKNSKNVRVITKSMKDIFDDDPDTIIGYEATIQFDVETYEQWVNGIFTKIVCEARNKNHLDKAILIAQELGLVEGKDYFLIKDACLTELVPEEYDEHGIGRTLTCIGFRPLSDDMCRMLSKKFQLLK